MGRSNPRLKRSQKPVAEPKLECDVTDLHSVEAVAAQVAETLGRLDILVNNAGIGGFGGPLHQLPPESWDQVLNTNLRGVYYCIRAFAPMMIRARAGTSLTSHPCRKECPAQRRGLRRVEMGTERVELLRRRGTAQLQHSSLGGLSRFGGHRTEPAHGQR